MLNTIHYSKFHTLCLHKHMAQYWAKFMFVKQFPKALSHLPYGWRDKSIFGVAHYVVVHSKIGLKNVKICWFDSGKWFWLSIFPRFVVAGGICSNADQKIRSGLESGLKMVGSFNVFLKILTEKVECFLKLMDFDP